MTQPLNHLKKILKQVKEISQTGAKCMAVFDLDSTLFDVSPRIQQILFDFSQTKDFQKKFPASCKALESIKTNPRDWGIKDALQRAGLDGHPEEFHEAIRKFWSRTFFSNEYLKYDKPYPGAVKYVQSLYENGALVIYLSARDTLRMGPGSEKILRHWKFPFDAHKAQLVLKPTPAGDDARFKSDYFESVKKNHSKIWFFENEPVNLEIVRKLHPDVELVFFDSTHSQRSHSPDDLPTIVHYLLDD